ncbi:hypothetical protein FQN53_004524 [Emmonsiellopsis sp. PD_33]|nr:hypothetical protein FQN53_004524 [Emmonsiellopsis sp. PD_33]
METSLQSPDSMPQQIHTTTRLQNPPGTDKPLAEPLLLELALDLTVWIGAECDAWLIYKDIYQDRLPDTPKKAHISAFVPEEKELLRKVLPKSHYQRMIDRSSVGATPVDVPLERLSRFRDGYLELKQIDLLKGGC